LRTENTAEKPPPSHQNPDCQITRRFFIINDRAKPKTLPELRQAPAAALDYTRKGRTSLTD